MVDKSRRNSNSKRVGKSTFANPLGRVHLGAVFHGVDGEVDLGNRLLLADGTNGIVDVGIARIVLLLLLAAVGRVGLLISGVHVGRRWAAIGGRGSGRGGGRRLCGTRTWSTHSRAMVGLCV